MTVDVGWLYLKGKDHDEVGETGQDAATEFSRTLPARVGRCVVHHEKKETQMNRKYIKASTDELSPHHREALPIFGDRR